MRKFAHKLLIFGGGALLLLYGLAFLLDRSAIDLYTDSVFTVQFKQLLAAPAVPEALIFGNSHNRSTDFATLGVAGYHLWQSGQDIFETRYKIRLVMPKAVNVKTVLIAVSYFSFDQDNGVIPSRKNIRKGLYASYPPLAAAQMIDNDFAVFTQSVINQFLPLDRVMNEDSWKYFLRSALSTRISKQGKAPKVITQVSRDGNVLSQKYKTCNFLARPALIDQTTLVDLPTHLEMLATMAANRPGLRKDTYRAFTGIIEYLQERNVRVVFYTPPYFETYTQLYDPQIVAFMQASIQRLQATHQVEYYDFSVDEDFIRNNQLFNDSNHLNRCGAQLFSAKLKKVLASHRPDTAASR